MWGVSSCRAIVRSVNVRNRGINCYVLLYTSLKCALSIVNKIGTTDISSMNAHLVVTKPFNGDVIDLAGWGHSIPMNDPTNGHNLYPLCIVSDFVTYECSIMKTNINAEKVPQHILSALSFSTSRKDFTLTYNILVLLISNEKKNFANNDQRYNVSSFTEGKFRLNKLNSYHKTYSVGNYWTSLYARNRRIWTIIPDRFLYQDMIENFFFFIIVPISSFF